MSVTLTTPELLPAPGGVEAPPAPSAAQRRKARWKWAVKATVAAAVLALLFTQVDLGGVWQGMRRASVPWLIAAFVLVMGLQLAVADRLRRLVAAQGERLSTIEVFEINLATLFYGLFLPGGNFTGIAIRFYRLGAANRSMLNTAVALFLDRVVATVTLLLVGVGFWLIERPAGTAAALWAMLAAAAGLSVLLLAVFAPAGVPVLGTFQRGLRRFGGAKLNRVADAMQSQWDLPRPTLALVFVLSTLSHLLGIAAYWAIARGMGLDLSFVTVGWLRSAMILATMIPVTPSGVGLREGAAVALFAGYGLAAEDAVAYSLIIFGVTVLSVGAVGGLLEARRLGKRDKSRR